MYSNLYTYKASECKRANIGFHCATSKSSLWNMEYAARGGALERPRIYRTSTYVMNACIYLMSISVISVHFQSSFSCTHTPEFETLILLYQSLFCRLTVHSYPVKGGIILIASHMCCVGSEKTNTLRSASGHVASEGINTLLPYIQ